MRRFFVLAALLLSSFALHAQTIGFGANKPADPVPVATPQFTLGMTRDELLSRLGQPKMHFTPTGNRYFSPAEYATASSVYPNLADVFMRKTGTNEYEIRCFYDYDASESRLHPVARLARVDLRLDRPKRAQEVLDDIPEASALCKSGCRALGTVTVNPVLIVYQEEPSPWEKTLAWNIATGWRESPATSGYVLAMKLTWDERPSVNVPQARSIAWLQHPIEIVQFGCTSPAFEYKMGDRNPPVEAGRWNPTLK